MVASGAFRRHLEVLPAERAGHQKNDNTHGLLSIVAPVAQAEPGRGYQLAPAKHLVHAPGRASVKKPSDRPGDGQADGQTNQGGQKDKQYGLANPRPKQRNGALGY